jgi:hypothetical protein
MSRKLWAVIACIGVAGGCAAEQVEDDAQNETPGGGNTPSTGGASAGNGAGGTPSTTGGNPATGGAPSTGGKPGAAGATSQAGSGGSATAGAAGTGAGGTPPKPANNSLPFKEDFEDGEANGFMPWNEDIMAGTWAVVADGAGKVYQPSAAVGELEFAVGGSSSWTDVAFTVKVRFNDEDSKAQVGIRFTAPKNYLYVEMGPPNSFKLRGRTNEGSTVDVVTPSTKPDIVAGTWYTVGITIKGTTASVTLDGMPIGSPGMANAGIAKGGVALGVAEGSVSWDDVTIVAAP